MRYLKYTLCTALLFLVAVACDVNSDRFPTDLEELHKPENTGGFARIVSSSGSVWNVLDITAGEYTVTLEVDDAENGGQLESIEFYVGFRGNAVTDAAQGTPANSSEIIRTIPASEFTADSETGLPRTTQSFTATELLNEVGVNAADVGINSTFLLRWQMNMTNGKTVGPDNSGSNITGGAFYSSPFAQNIAVALEIPSTQFVGTYEMVQNSTVSGGAIGGFGDGWVFGADDTEIVEISVDPDNTLNGRTFTAYGGGYLDAIGFGTEIDPINFAFTRTPTGNNYTTMTNQAGTGLACSSLIVLAAPAEVAQEGTWTDGDDSSFTLTMVDDATADCGAPSAPISFTFTKQ